MAISDEVRSYVEKRLQNIDKFAPAEARAEVELAYTEHTEGPKYRAELMYHEPGAPLARAEARGSALHEAIDIAAGDLLHQVSSRKKRGRQVFRRTAVKVKEYLRGWRGKI